MCVYVVHHRLVYASLSFLLIFCRWNLCTYSKGMETIWHIRRVFLISYACASQLVQALRNTATEYSCNHTAELPFAQYYTSNLDVDCLRLVRCVYALGYAMLPFLVYIYVMSFLFVYARYFLFIIIFFFGISYLKKYECCCHICLCWIVAFIPT